MVGEHSNTSMSRRTALKQATVLVAGGGLFASSTVGASGTTPDGGAATLGSDEATLAARQQEESHEGYTLGTAPDEDEPMTVEPRCEGEDCETILLTGLSPACATDSRELFVNLSGTEPRVWVAPREEQNRGIQPGRYSVLGVETCEASAQEANGNAVYRVRFRPVA